jgi:hypothetical protein
MESIVAIFLLINHSQLYLAITCQPCYLEHSKHVIVYLSPKKGIEIGKD